MGQEEKYMDEYIKEISEKIDSKKDYYAEISNKIWEFAEPRFQEYRSSELLQHVLKQAGIFHQSRSGRREDCIYCRIWIRKTSHSIPWRI